MEGVLTATTQTVILIALITDLTVIMAQTATIQDLTTIIQDLVATTDPTAATITATINYRRLLAIPTAAIRTRTAIQMAAIRI
jgi:hypothetical protein